MPKGEHQGLNDLVENVEIITNTIEDTYECIANLGGDKDIMFVADRTHVITGGIQQLQENLQGIGIHSVTTFLVDLTGDVVDEDLPYGPLETFGNLMPILLQDTAILPLILLVQHQLFSKEHI